MCDCTNKYLEFQVTGIGTPQGSGTLTLTINQITENSFICYLPWPYPAVYTVEITDTETASTLHDKLSSLGAKLLIETLPSILNGTNERVPQDSSKASYGFIIKREDEKIDFFDAFLKNSPLQCKSGIIIVGHLP